VIAYLPQLSDIPDPLASLKETKVCVDNGTWALYRWNPTLEEEGEMFILDSQHIKRDLEAFLARKNYLTQVMSSHPDISNVLASSLETVS
jgi:sulfite reductase (NADPH) hemoprotein beta-component